MQQPRWLEEVLSGGRKSATTFRKREKLVAFDWAEGCSGFITFSVSGRVGERLPGGNAIKTFVLREKLTVCKMTLGVYFLRSLGFLLAFMAFVKSNESIASSLRLGSLKARSGNRLIYRYISHKTCAINLGNFFTLWHFTTY